MRSRCLGSLAASTCGVPSKTPSIRHKTLNPKPLNKTGTEGASSGAQEMKWLRQSAMWLSFQGGLRLRVQDLGFRVRSYRDYVVYKGAI